MADETGWVGSCFPLNYRIRDPEDLSHAGMGEASEIEPVDLWRSSEPEPTGLARRFLFQRW